MGDEESVNGADDDQINPGELYRLETLLIERMT